jgi:hypothetical protein
MVADPEPEQRTVEVPLRRLGRWVEGFAARHGQTSTSRASDVAGWLVSGADGARALVHEPAWAPPDPGEPADASAALADLARTRPTYGVLLLRRAGYAVARCVADEVVDRKVGSRHIHGRTAAGGWSQQRYARRRANQADEIVEAAAAAAGRILAGPGIAFLVTGGDRPLLAAALARLDPPLQQLPVAVHLGVGTPDAQVLAGVPDRVMSVRIDIAEP